MAMKLKKGPKATNDIKEMLKGGNSNNAFSSIIDVVLKCVPIAISIFALVISFWSYNDTKKNNYYNRIFQPLNYYYNFTIDNELTDIFNQYHMPIITCHINPTSGCISKIMLITTNNKAIDSVYDYNSKMSEIGLFDGMGVTFDLKFSSIFEFEKCIYQYMFIYVEGTNKEWNLDCLEVRYNENQILDQISILDTNDLLRKNAENNEIQSTILDDYEMVFNKIKNL